MHSENKIFYEIELHFSLFYFLARRQMLQGASSYHFLRELPFDIYFLLLHLLIVKKKLTGFSISYWIFFTKCNFWHFSTGFNHIFQERWINKKRGHVKIFALCHSHCWLCSKSFLLFVVCYLGYMRLLEEMLLQWYALVFFRFTVDIDKDLFITMTFHIKSRWGERRG